MGGGRGQESEESRIIYFPSPGDKNGKLLIKKKDLEVLNGQSFINIQLHLRYKQANNAQNLI